MGVTIFDNRDGLDWAVGSKKILQLYVGGCRIQISYEDVRHNCVSNWLVKAPTLLQKQKEAISSRSRLSAVVGSLQCLHVFRLPAFWSLGDIELHSLAFLQALKATRLDGGEVNENVFAILTADKAVAFGVIEPLYCSLFHLFVLLFLCDSYAGGIRKNIWAGSLLMRRELLTTDSV